jgi:hypothetical protein
LQHLLLGKHAQGQLLLAQQVLHPVQAQQLTWTSEDLVVQGLRVLREAAALTAGHLQQQQQVLATGVHRTEHLLQGQQRRRVRLQHWPRA